MIHLVFALVLQKDGSNESPENNIYLPANRKSLRSRIKNLAGNVLDKFGKTDDQDTANKADGANPPGTPASGE